MSVSNSVIGLSDGLTVPFALTAGLSSLGESKLVIVGGVAELIAGAISMGIGGFLASQAERDHHRYLRRTTRARVKRSCDGEMEREVHAILGPVGVDQSVSRQVALGLLEVEAGADGSGNGYTPTDAEHGLKWSQSVGVTEFLLRFGEGLGAHLHLLHLLCIGLTLLWSRGGPNTPPLPVCIYDRDGLSHRRRYPIIPLLLHPDRTYRARLLVHLNWHRFTHLRCCQGEGYWCSWKGSWRIRMGRSIHTGSRWCCGCGCVWLSRTLRGKGLKSLELS
jgi:VIT family